MDIKNKVNNYIDTLNTNDKLLLATTGLVGTATIGSAAALGLPLLIPAAIVITPTLIGMGISLAALSYTNDTSITDMAKFLMASPDIMSNINSTRANLTNDTLNYLKYFNGVNNTPDNVTLNTKISPQNKLNGTSYRKIGQCSVAYDISHSGNIIFEQEFGQNLASKFLTYHEMGHCSFNNFSDEKINNSLKKSLGIESNVFKFNIYKNIVSECYADTISTALLIKTLDKEQYNQFLDKLITLRQEADKSAFASDPHITSKALIELKKIGFDKLTNLSAMQLSDLCLDISTKGFVRSLGENTDQVKNYVKQIQNHKSIKPEDKTYYANSLNDQVLEQYKNMAYLYQDDANISSKIQAKRINKTEEVNTNKPSVS